MKLSKLLSFKDYLNEKKIWVTINKDKSDNRPFSTMKEAIHSEVKDNTREIKEILESKIHDYIHVLVADKFIKE
jgi:hypothetical protein